MDSEWTLFVEGKDDKAFLDSLLDHLGIYNVSTNVIGGGVSKLSNFKPQIHRARDSGNQVAVILDADGDAAVCRNLLVEVIYQNELPIERHFLLPDNNSAGRLENLLESIAVSDHRYIYHCFDTYNDCLSQSQHAYSLPGGKARIYAYCEALDIETNGTRRRYNDESHWDLEATDLEPLKHFLLELR